MSTEIPPARIILSGLISLENRQAVPEKPYSFIYDGTFTCADSPIDGVGSFRFFIGQDKTKKQDNDYKMNAKVHHCPQNLAIRRMH